MSLCVCVCFFTCAMYVFMDKKEGVGYIAFCFNFTHMFM